MATARSAPGPGTSQAFSGDSPPPGGDPGYGNQPPWADDDYYSVLHDQTLSDPAPGVLWNDYDPEGDPLTAQLVSGPQNGSVTLNPDGSFTYEPDPGFAGQDSFTYQAHDGTQGSNTATVWIDVVNTPPWAEDDFRTIQHDAVLQEPAPGVLANDYDPDGDSLTVSLISGPTYAVDFELNPDGSFLYEPLPHWAGTDSFVYEITDGIDTAQATVTIDVLPGSPWAEYDYYDVPHDQTLQVDAPGVLENDSTDTGMPLTATLVTGPSNAANFTLNPDGSFTYEPNPGFAGMDGFEYEITDGTGTDRGWVTIFVNNAVPVAADDYYQQVHDTPITAPQSVLENDEDLDGDSLSVTLVQGPQYAADFAFNPDGTFFYDPQPGWLGTDSFLYEITDGIATAQATAWITYTNEPPWAQGEYYSLVQDTALEVLDPAQGLLSNDQDPDGDSLSVQVTVLPQHGTLQWWADGTFRYTPAAGYVGPDEFTYQISDGLATDTATVTLDVLDGSPVADDLYYLLEDFPLEVDASQGVLSNDHPDAAPAQLVTPPQYGTLDWFEPDGSFRYVPGPDFPGEDQYEYLAQAPGGGQEVAVVRLVKRSVGIQSLTFLNIHAITPDGIAGAGPYQKNHWYDDKADGAINDPKDHKYPVAYTRNKPWSAEAKLLFHKQGNPAAVSGKGKLWLFGYVYDDDGTPVKSPQGTPLVLSNAMPVNLNGNETSVTIQVTANGNWPDSVQHFDDLKIVWNLVFQTPSGQSNNQPLGETYNDVYLTLKDPANLNTLYWTVVHIGSHNAEGAKTEADTVTQIWNDFSDRDIKRIDGTRLTYWIPGQTDQQNASNCRAKNTSQLLRDGHGQCGAWADFLIATFKAQGITNAQRIMVTNADQANMNTPASLWKYGLLVKNWETAAGPLRPMTRPQNYRLLIPSEISPAPGTAGQGNPDPPSIFLNHFIVKWSGQFYDPSYGGPVYPTQEAWENGSLAGFFYIDRRVIQIHPLVIGEKRWAKLNDPTKTETRFTPVQ